MKKERLTIEDRILTEKLLRQNYKLKDIASVIGVYPRPFLEKLNLAEKETKSLIYAIKLIGIHLYVLIVLRKFTVIKENIITITKKLKKNMKTN